MLYAITSQRWIEKSRGTWVLVDYVIAWKWRNPLTDTSTNERYVVSI